MTYFLIFFVIFIGGHYLLLTKENANQKVEVRSFGQSINFSLGWLIFMNVIDGIILGYILFVHILK